MRFVSWNVAGLRALHKKGNWDWLVQTSPDIFCLQEIKAFAEQLPDEVRSPSGYHAYFASSQEKKGYSGVAIYSKEEPTEVRFGLGIPDFDIEGRLIEAHFKDYVLFNIYFPNSGRDLARLAYRLEFNDALLERLMELGSLGKSVIVTGDFNVAHETIDIARPKDNEGKSGFHPDERAWFDALLNIGYVDAFRHVYPNKKDSYTYWDQITRARDRNVGWRIDYFLVTQGLVPRIKEIKHHTDVFGSDHCPVELVFKK
jgi:exodeoxyribonuclease-3